MSGPVIRVEGLARLRSTMRKAGLDMQDLKEANARASQIVAQRGRPTAPHRTGRLAGTVRGTRQARRARVLAGSAGVRYAGPIHWGWPARHIRAQPWLSRAAQASEAQWLPAYWRDVQRILDRVKGY